MPLLHCSNCHHEYTSYNDDWEHDLCDWCGSTPYMLKERTELEDMAYEMDEMGWNGVIEQIKGWLNEIKT